MAKSISDWVDYFKIIPTQLMDEGCFRIGSQIAKKLLGVEDDNVQPDEEIVATLTQVKEDDDELSPQWIAEMEVMMQAYDKKKTITEDFDRPSFVLFPETQSEDRPESSARAETVGTSGVNDVGQNATQETLVMTDVDSSDDEGTYDEHHYTDMGNDGAAQHGPPAHNPSGNVSATLVIEPQLAVGNAVTDNSDGGWKGKEDDASDKPPLKKQKIVAAKGKGVVCDGNGAASTKKTIPQRAVQKAPQEKLVIGGGAKKNIVPVADNEHPKKRNVADTRQGKGVLATGKENVDATGKENVDADVMERPIQRKRSEKNIGPRDDHEGGMTPIAKGKAKVIETRGKGKAYDLHSDFVEDQECKKAALTRVKRKGFALRSPFNEREVKITKEANAKDKELFYWILDTIRKEPDSIVYKDNAVSTRKESFLSLGPYKKVNSAVLMAWSSYLNNMEKMKSVETVLRMFFSTQTSKPFYQLKEDGNGEPNSFEFFWTNILNDTLPIPEFRWENYTLFFFPVTNTSSYFLICFDLVAGKMHIIDHTPTDTHNSFNEKYGNTPHIVKKIFEAALEKYHVPKIAVKVRKCTTNLVTVPWRTILNPQEDGVYLMRHMETFLGASQKNWECGLTAKGVRSLSVLRIKYMRTLLTCDHNSRKEINQARATIHWNEKPRKFSFGKWFEEYGLE